ncbi:MATE efflux family protein [Gemmatirosa kalamazoonensis]|uniref:MATE efflux family protein n=1 Tax=Gemmatirosa kalamazoonensis TaxID=861299 RepID=W0RC17_9BACT|nr:MATE family efflux transporter [Gemmatirosa kalamazoonensis]AHG88649.1 MATE efflux family protein [Gemmatirosa kalamazoonensis]
MANLTSGPVTRHLLKTTSFMLVTMVFQTLYFLVDLYWVGRLGTDAVAAVGIAGNLNFVVLALTQMLGVGTTTLVSHAAGRGDHEHALLAFNQSQVLAMLTGLGVLVAGLAGRGVYAASMGADARTAALAADYLLWFVPALALQFGIVAMGAALRGMGNFRPGMIVGTTTVIVNTVLAPFLIFGWGTGHPLGVAGAALSTLIALAVGVAWLTTYFLPKDAPLRFVVADWRPRLDLWKRIVAIGLPAGVEFALMAAYMMIVYVISRPFGAAAQAGFGIGQRVVQSGFMPVVALGFSVAPVAGQNFGARLAGRVRETFRDAAWMAGGVMLAFALLCKAAPAALVGIFSHDAATIAVGVEYLRIVSWNFVASGVVFVTSSMFQAMGNTVPSLATSGLRLLLSALPALALSRAPGFQLSWVWYLSVLSVWVQLGVALLLLRREYRLRLAFPAAPSAEAASAGVAAPAHALAGAEARSTA